MNDLGAEENSEMNLFFPFDSLYNFLPRKGLSKFSEEGSFELFSWRRDFDVCFYFLRPPIINGRPLSFCASQMSKLKKNARSYNSDLFTLL